MDNINLIFDLDGTIISNGEKLSQAGTRRLCDFSNDYNIIFASARPVRDMLPLIPSDLHHATFIGCNGGQVWKNNSFVYSYQIPKGEAVQIISLLKELRVPYILDSDWHYSVSEIPHAFHDYLRSLSSLEVSENENMNLGITKILVLDRVCQDFLKESLLLRGVSANLHTHTKDQFFDITPMKINKAEALKKLGVNFQSSLSSGNDFNDFEMLRKSEVSIFVGCRSMFSCADYYCSMDDLFVVLEEGIRSLHQKLLETPLQCR
ncbi:HAD family hydrolase [Vibrio sp. Of7-15]|uniref:HAD hydrolase family protein n=1 Tax=Vibrio sp. Of7-15 TaxID=2724879 RepID=UPI001EF18258|nr:HAD hydrolase family protein [Vibrio sp. Of7-15]MCG7498312.1 HAD family hydrolase [Vibrio sp. Of7-15]